MRNMALNTSWALPANWAIGVLSVLNSLFKEMLWGRTISSVANSTAGKGLPDLGFCRAGMLVNYTLSDPSIRWILKREKETNNLFS